MGRAYGVYGLLVGFRGPAFTACGVQVCWALHAENPKGSKTAL